MGNFVEFKIHNQEQSNFIRADIITKIEGQSEMPIGCYVYTEGDGHFWINESSKDVHEKVVQAMKGKDEN